MKTISLKIKRRLSLFVAIIMALTLWTALPLTASATDSDPTSVDSVTTLQTALSTDVTDITLTETFYTSLSSQTTPIEINGSHTQHVTIAGIDSSTIPVGLNVTVGNVTLKDVNVTIASMTDTNVAKFQWGTSSNHYGAGIGIGQVADVTLDSCEVTVTNTVGPTFTTGVWSQVTSGLTVKDCEIAATGKGTASVAGLLIYMLMDGTTVTGNDLSAVHQTPVSGDQGNIPAEALFINRLPTYPAAVPSDWVFSGNTLQSGTTVNKPAAPFSFYVNVNSTDAKKGVPEMTEDSFGSYDVPGVRPWIMDYRNNSEIYKLVTTLVSQSGNGYGFVFSWIPGTSNGGVQELYDITDGKITAIDFWGTQIVNGEYNDILSQGRVDVNGVARGDEYHWSKTETDVAIKNGSTISDKKFTQTGYTELTYTAAQVGGAAGTATTTGIEVTFNAAPTTATDIKAYVTTAAGSEEIALTATDDSNDATWQINTAGLTFSNGETVTVDLFGVPGNPITTAAQSVTLYKYIYVAPSTPPVDEPTEPDEPATDEPATDEPAPVVVEPAAPVVDSESGVAETAVTEDLIDKAVADAEAAIGDSDKSTQIKIDVPKAEGDTSGVAVSLPTAQLGKVADSEAVDELIVSTEAGDFEIGSTALANIVQSAGAEETVTLSITKEDAEAVPPADRPQMADAAIFEVEIRAGQTVIHEIGSVIKVSLPYTLKSGETAANVRVYYIPDQGEPQKIDGATYDAVAAKVTFPTNHLSLWAVKADSETVPPDEPAAKNGWVKQANGTWKYYTDGKAKTGWVYDKSYTAWYYLDKTTEIMKTGWVRDNGKWYYLASNGKMKAGWVKDDGNWYYLAGNGAMAWGTWLHDTDGSWYYLSGNGTMLTGKHNIGGKAYTFKSNGVWVG
jgi:hypothetical protein